MKKITYFLLLILFVSTAQAQNTEQFNKLAKEAKALIEKKSFIGAQTKIEQLEKELTTLKKSSPSYNASNLEAEIINLKESLATSKGKREDEKANNENATVNAIELKKMLDGVFNISSFSFKNLETAQAENDAYKTEVDQLLGMKGDLTSYIAEMKKSNDYDLFTGKMKTSYDRNFSTFIESKKRILAQSTGGEDANWKNTYYEMQAEQIRWDAAQKVFPDEPKFAEAYQKITVVVNEYGGLDKISAQNKVNNAEKIKNQLLPVAIVRDANLEKMFIDAFDKKYGLEYKGTATKAIMLQTDWQTERHKITGLVTGRIRQGAIVYKGTNGKCYLVSIMHLYQEYIGTNFVNTKAVYAQDGQEMLCQNAK